MTVSLLLEVVIILLVCGAASFLVKRAPFVDESYKPAILWVILAFAVIAVIVLMIPLIRSLG